MKREERKKIANKKLIPRICFLIVFFVSAACIVFARGQTDETEIKTQNDEWILLITNFDSSALSDEKKPVSDLVMRKLAENISFINHRVRVSEEYAYYEEYAWNNARQAAAKALADKQNERSLLLYKGETERAYKINLAKFDNEIKTLQEKLEEIENTLPAVNREPVFKLKDNNRTYQFPEPPKAGGEYRFCSNEKADGIIIGSVSDYYGRFLVTVKLYTVFTRSFVWEDRTIFSREDINDAMEDVARKLLINLSGSKPAAVAVTSRPEDALVLINRSLVETGESSILEYPPRTIQVTASAPNYESISFSTALAPGELSNIFINLKPIEYGELTVTGAENGIAGSLYHGALYIGESPITFQMPLDQMEYLEFTALDDKIGKIVFQMPYTEGLSDSIDIPTRAPPKEGSVDFARRLFYWSWGATWAAGVTAYITNHSYNNIAHAFYQTGNTSYKLYNDANRMFNIRNAAVIGLGVMAVIDIILITRYIYLSNKGAAPARISN